MTKIKSNFQRLGWQILLLLSIYFFCRLLFIWINRIEFNFPAILPTLYLFGGGMRFDLAAICMINGLFILLTLLPAPFIENSNYQKVVNYLFLISNSLFILLNIVDIAYFPFIHKRMQVDAFMFLTGKKGTDFFRLLPSFIKQFWYLLFIYMAIIYTLRKGYLATLKSEIKAPKGLGEYVLASVFFILGLA